MFELNENDGDLLESLLKQLPKKVSVEWMHCLVRHASKQGLDFGDVTDGEELGRYDGEIVARIINLLQEARNAAT